MMKTKNQNKDWWKPYLFLLIIPFLLFVFRKTQSPPSVVVKQIAPQEIVLTDDELDPLPISFCIVPPDVTFMSERDTMNSADALIIPGLKNVLVVVIQDTYEKTGRDHVISQIIGVENTWGRWIPHLLIQITDREVSTDTELIRKWGFLPTEIHPLRTLVDSIPINKDHHIQVLSGSKRNKHARHWNNIYKEVEKHKYQWVFVVTLQTYVLAPNLCTLIENIKLKSVDDALVVGRPMLITGEKIPQPFASAGQLISVSSLRLVTDGKRIFNNIFYELWKKKVVIRDSRDEKGRERFHSFRPLGTVDISPKPWVYSYTGWFSDYSPYGLHADLECCSPSTVTFHYMKPKGMASLHYILNMVSSNKLHHSEDDPFSREYWNSDDKITNHGKRYWIPKHNSDVRTLLAQQIALASDANVDRLLQTPQWIDIKWKDSEWWKKVHALPNFPLLNPNTIPETGF